MKETEKFILLPYDDYNKLCKLESQESPVLKCKDDTNGENTGSLISSINEQKDGKLAEDSPVKPSSQPEDFFNVDDFVKYVAQCEGASCSTNPVKDSMLTENKKTLVKRNRVKTRKKSKWIVI